MKDHMGEMLDGRYKVLEKVGEGGRVVTYKGWQNTLERSVLIKYIEITACELSDIENFWKEVKRIARLSHTNINKLFDFGRAGGEVYLVLEDLTRHETLARRLGSPIHWQAARSILQPVARALHHAHLNDVVHSHLTPSDIVLLETDEPVVLNFEQGSILKLYDDDKPSESVAYLAPEVLNHVGSDARSDIFSLGVILYEMVTGRKPYVADSVVDYAILQMTQPVPPPSQVIADLPPALEQVILTALAKDAPERYRDMRSFELALSTERDLTYDKYASPSREPAAPPTIIDPVKPSERTEEVLFTAYHPKEGQVDTWHTLLVYAHIESAVGTVWIDAHKFEDEIKPIKETASKSTARIARGTELTIIPACTGVSFNPVQVSFRWAEDFHRASFRFKAEPVLAEDAASGQISIYAGPLLIGAVKFAMLFNAEAEPSHATTDEESINEQEEQTNMYASNRIFISYSHKDTELALLFRNVLEAVGYDVLIDIDDLRAGQVWNDELMHMIEHADIFQLFWSVNSSQSEYCRLEWQHALKQNKPAGFIRPIYWQKPIPAPPDELSKFHFDYVELKPPH